MPKTTRSQINLRLPPQLQERIQDYCDSMASEAPGGATYTKTGAIIFWIEKGLAEAEEKRRKGKK